MKKKIILGIVAATTLSLGAVGALATSKSIQLKATDDLGEGTITMGPTSVFAPEEEGVWTD